MEKIKKPRGKNKAPIDFSMVSIDVKSLFTSAHLTKTIDIILGRVYNRKEIPTVLTKDEMKKLLTLCNKNAYFTLPNKIYLQNDGGGYRFSFRTRFSKCIPNELENTLVLRLHHHAKKWRRYVDGTFAYVQNESIDYFLTTPVLFHSNVRFTYE